MATQVETQQANTLLACGPTEPIEAPFAGAQGCKGLAIFPNFPAELRISLAMGPVLAGKLRGVQRRLAGCLGGSSLNPPLSQAWPTLCWSAKVLIKFRAS
jgi:hypothetical protein